MSTFVLTMLLGLSSGLGPGRAETSAPAAQANAAGDPLPPGALLRVGSARFGHLNNITWMGFADSQTLLTACGDHEFRFWNVATGKLSARFPSGPLLRNYFAISADHKKLLLGESAMFTLVDVAGRKAIRSFHAEELVGSKEEMSAYHRFILSPDGRQLAIWDRPYLGDAQENKKSTNVLTLWDLEGTARIHEWKTGDLFEVEFTPDGKTITAQERDIRTKKYSLCSWETGSGKEVRRIVLPRALIRFQYLPDGKTLLGLSEKRDSLHRFDAETGKELRPIAGKGGFIQTFALSPDGKRLAVAQGEHLIVHEFDSGKTLLDLPFPTLVPSEWGLYARDEYLQLVAFSPDGRTLAVAKGSQLALWDLVTGRPTHVAAIRGMVAAVETNGNHLLTRDSTFGLSLWDLSTGRLERRFRRAVPKTSSPEGEPAEDGRLEIPGMSLRWFGSMQAISPDGTRLAALWPEGPIHVWDIHSGNLLHTLTESDKAVCLAFSPDGKLLAAHAKTGIGLWDVKTGKLAQILPTTAPAVLALAFSPDGRTLAATVLGDEKENGQMFFWELASGNLRRRLGTNVMDMRLGRSGNILGVLAMVENTAFSLAYSRDGKRLTGAGLRSIRVWDALTVKEIRRFGGRQVAAQSAVFSPDGKLLAAGLEDGSIRFWDAASGTVLRDVPAHQTLVSSLAFARNGKALVSGSLDGSAIVWDMACLLRTPSPATPHAELEPLWKDLAQTDAEKALTAIQAFVDRPKETVAFFKARMRPAPVVEPACMLKMVAELEAESFVARDEAVKNLEQMGERARCVLEKTLAGMPTLETRRRVEMILQKLTPPLTGPDQLRSVRAVEVLERIGTPGARRVLTSLAGGAAGDRLTEDAKAAVGRLGR